MGGRNSTQKQANDVNTAVQSGDEDVIDKLTEAQLDEFREAFAAFDNDGGGSIDATELKALMASVGQIPTDDELSEMIRIADADGSGSVDFYEFVTLMAHKMADTKDQSSLKASFSLFDHSGDGFIDSDEMRRLMINVGEPVTIEDVNELIREVDLDGDGVVNYDEFTKVVCAEGRSEDAGVQLGVKGKKARNKSRAGRRAAAAQGAAPAAR